MTMAEDDSDLVEVEEEEIEATVKERHFEVGETEIELEDVERDEDDYTGDREALVNFLIEINENNPDDIGQGDEEGDEVEEEEIEPVIKTRDPENDLIYSGNMRDKTDLFADEEWETVEPEED